MIGQRVQLHRALSKKGICSRSRAMPLIREGHVNVNGKIITDPLTWVNVETDRIMVEGVVSPPPSVKEKIYIAMNKPSGYVTSAADELERLTVYDLLPVTYKNKWLFPVGRLDKESRGLLLFTNDGPWADKLTGPASHVEKIYEVKTDIEPDEELLEDMASGTEIDGKRTLPAGIERIGECVFRIKINEGRNRQVRRIFGRAGCTVKELTRTSIGSIKLDGLKEREIRVLTEMEIFGLLGKASI